jgi:tRNA pseudouridine38-40 synthase
LTVKAELNEWDSSPLIVFTVSADGFLRYMVRSIAGALMAVGRGELILADLKQAIDSGERPVKIVTAPACGLTLWRVRYD